MKTMTTDDWKADELHSGDVELTEKWRTNLGGGLRNGRVSDGTKLIVKAEDRAALAALLAGKRE